MPRHARVLVLLLSTSAAACASPGTLSTSGPFDIGHAPDEGLRYFLTRDLLTVDAKVSQFREVVRGRSGVCEPHDSVATSWTLTVTTVPDRRQAYRLGLTPSGLARPDTRRQSERDRCAHIAQLRGHRPARRDRQRHREGRRRCGGRAVRMVASRPAAIRAARRSVRAKPVPCRRGMSSEPSISPSCRRRPIPARPGRRSRGRTRRSRTISSCSRSRISSCPCLRCRSPRARSSRRPTRGARPSAARARTRCARRSTFASRSCA